MGEGVRFGMLCMFSDCVLLYIKNGGMLSSLHILSVTNSCKGLHRY